MQLQFIGADHEVTGSCHFIEACGKYMLVDYGMEQGINLYENVPLPVDETQIDYVFLTHAHIDHSGLLPLLYAKGFRGKIFATKATTELSSIMLRDSAHIQMFEAEWRNRKAKRAKEIEGYNPIYTMQDADGAIKCLVPCPYGKTIDVDEGIQIRFNDIGHLLGSAAIEIWLTEEKTTKKLVFSGDIGNKGKPLVKAPEKIAEADYVVIESTYGDRFHPATDIDYVSELTKILKETFDRGGNVVIPSFAVGRTQELLYYLRIIKTEGRVKGHEDFPVYVDSPLAVEATSIFHKNIEECFDEESLRLVEAGINPISFPDLSLSITSEESKAINFEDTPKVILSASGMCEAGRIRHHLKHNLWRPECTILFVGYQAVGTLGRSLCDGAKEVRLFGETVDVRANILQVHGLSGHADKGGLTDWILGFETEPKKVFVVHGDDEVCDIFADYLREEHGFDTYAPYSGAVYDLAEDKLVASPEGVRITKKKRAASAVFERLLAAGQRLLAVIRHNEGGANKDLAKFADQINSLCDKWDR